MGPFGWLATGYVLGGLGKDDGSGEGRSPGGGGGNGSDICCIVVMFFAVAGFLVHPCVGTVFGGIVGLVLVSTVYGATSNPAAAAGFALIGLAIFIVFAAGYGLFRLASWMDAVGAFYTLPFLAALTGSMVGLVKWKQGKRNSQAEKPVDD